MPSATPRGAACWSPAGGAATGCARGGARQRPGIAPESQELIFHEFVQLDNPERGQDKGLGLGLAIVRRLSTLLRLPLELRSRPGHGTVFAVEVPAASWKASPRAHTPAASKGCALPARILPPSQATAELFRRLGLHGGRRHPPAPADDRPHGTELLILAGAPPARPTALSCSQPCMRPDLADVPAILFGRRQHRRATRSRPRP